MLRFTLAIFLPLAGFLPSSGVGQDLPPNVITTNAAVSAGQTPERRTELNLADQALAAGLSSTATDLYTLVLADPKLNETDREKAGLGLTAALIERARTAEATAAIKALPKSGRKTLREGLIALLENNTAAAKAFSSSLDLTTLPPHEVAWGHALRWTVAATENDNLTINLSIEAIGRTAISEEQRQRIEVLGYRASIVAGQVEDRTLNALRELAAAAQGTPLAFAYARNLALAEAHKGNLKNAAEALSKAGQLSPARQAESDLLAGLILGSNTPEGRQKLKDAAKNPANTAVRLTALRALVAAAAPPAKANSLNDASDYKAIANEVNDFLLRRNPGQLSYFCPRDIKVLDAIHLARAQLMLFAGNREKARQAAEDLLKDVPASPLAREATRTLAIATWGDGSYRLASTHLTTLAESSVNPERAQLRIAAADCLFLAKDFVLAEKAYAALQKDAADTKIAEDAFHQRILCLLETNDDFTTWSRTCEIIEEMNRSNRTSTRKPIWSAIWNLVEDARKSNRPADADKLLTRLAPLTTGTDLEFSLRFDWQRALISIANNKSTQAAQFADQIIVRLKNLPANEPMLKAAPELSGYAALLKARTALDAGSPKGLEELVALRKNFGKVPAAAASYLIEGRHHASKQAHAEAQACFESLAKEFQDEPALAEFAALGLYEAAEEAAAQAAHDGEVKLKYAIELLERFTDKYPQNPLIFRVALRRAEILRSLTQFDKALLVLENLIREKPTDPSRPQAEMARADSLFGLAELRRDLNGQLSRQRVGRAADAYERIAESTWAKDSPEISTEAWYKWAVALIERAKTETALEAKVTRLEARKVLIRTFGILRGPTATNITEGAQKLSSEGRLWLARSILLMGEICEQDGDREEAIAAYKTITEVNRGLPTNQPCLTGQATAESKLASLRKSSSNPATPQ